MAFWRKVKQEVRRTRQEMWALENFPAFRLGYISALNDIERTGLRPMTDKTKREAADRALKLLVAAPSSSTGGPDGD